MADHRSKIGDRLNAVQSFGGFIGWLWGLAATHWPATMALVTGSLMGFLASFSKRIDSWGAVGWGAVGICTALLAYMFLATGYAAIAWAKDRAASARLKDVIASKGPTAFNRLEPQFTRQRINVSDLIHPLGEPLSGKVFTECDFFGPGLMMLSGSRVTGLSGGHIEIVRLKDDLATRAPNKATLIGCHLIACKYYNVVLGLPSADTDGFKKLFPALLIVGEA